MPTSMCAVCISQCRLPVRIPDCVRPKTGTIKARRPGIQAQARKLSDGTFLIAYENAPPAQGDSERRLVFDLVMSKPGNPKEGMLMTLGLPASEGPRGLKFLALLKSKIRIDW